MNSVVEPIQNRMKQNIAGRIKHTKEYSPGVRSYYKACSDVLDNVMTPVRVEVESQGLRWVLEQIDEDIQ